MTAAIPPKEAMKSNPALAGTNVSFKCTTKTMPASTQRSAASTAQAEAEGGVMESCARPTVSFDTVLTGPYVRR